MFEVFPDLYQGLIYATQVFLLRVLYAGRYFVFYSPSGGGIHWLSYS